jgi:hypothetical protein
MSTQAIFIQQGAKLQKLFPHCIFQSSIFISLIKSELIEQTILKIKVTNQLL